MLTDEELRHAQTLEAAEKFERQRTATLKAAEKLVKLLKWWEGRDYEDGDEVIFDLEFVFELGKIVDPAEIPRSDVAERLNPSDEPPF